MSALSASSLQPTAFDTVRTIINQRASENYVDNVQRNADAFRKLKAKMQRLNDRISGLGIEFSPYVNTAFNQGGLNDAANPKLEADSVAA